MRRRVADAAKPNRTLVALVTYSENYTFGNYVPRGVARRSTHVRPHQITDKMTWWGTRSYSAIRISRRD